MRKKFTNQTSSSNWRPGIRFYLIMMNLVLLCFLLPTISIFFFSETSSFRDAQLERTILNLRQSLESRGLSLVRSLALSAEQAIGGYDYTFLNNMMAQVVENDPELLYALVMGDQGQVMAHNRIDMMGNIIKDDLALQATTIMKKKFVGSTEETAHSEPVELVEGVFTQNGEDALVLEFVVPVHIGKKVVGVMRCGFSLQSLTSEINLVRQEWAEKMERIRTFFLSITAIFFCIGMLVAGFFTRFFVYSTTVLSEGVRQIAGGDLKHKIPARLMFCREFGHFATGFNEMTYKLRKSLKQLDEYNRSLEQKVKERTQALREAQSELVQQAHEAGMAEMAVGVLHNIGNAITPAKVDASLLIRRLRDSPLRSGLDVPASNVIKGLQDPNQLTEAEKERLVEISRILPATIREEYDRAIDGLAKICNRHEHIEDIIRLQMRYAKIIDESEEIDLNIVVEDALQMLNESIQQRGIEVQKHFSKVPFIKIEQAKLIQIVINIIKNGYEAMDMEGLEERRLIISTFLEQGEQSQVALSVKDTGCGFSLEEKEKMFQFGYTTKQTGSGFGLHSCANFMIANNGSLSANSEGKGKGADMVVRFQVPDVPVDKEAVV